MILKTAGISYGVSGWSAVGMIGVGGLTLGLTIGLFSLSASWKLSPATSPPTPQGAQQHLIFLQPLSTGVDEKHEVIAEMSMEVENAGGETAVQKALPTVRGEILSQLAEHDLRALRTHQGMQELRDDIKDSLNKLVPRARIKHVYVNQLVIIETQPAPFAGH